MEAIARLESVSTTSERRELRERGIRGAVWNGRGAGGVGRLWDEEKMGVRAVRIG